MAGPIALTESCCKTPCTEPEVINIPGPAGNDGVGQDGEDGLSPVTTVTAQFLMPAEGANVTVAVGNSEGLVAGQPVFVQTAGHMQVISKPNNISVILQNLENTAAALYPNNAAPTTAIPSGSLISPAGFQGNAGVLSGAAGGHLKGTYPNPTLNIGEAKGMLIVGDGTDAQEFSVGTNKTIPHADSAQALGMQWRGVDLSGGTTTISGAVPIANGGHGQITANLGFNALSPVTTRGDLIVRNATVNARLAIGASGRVLTSNGTDPSWNLLGLVNFDPSFKPSQRAGAIISVEDIDLDAAAGSDTGINFPAGVTRVIIRRVILESTMNLTGSAARLGIYTAIAKGGQILVADPNSQLTSIVSASTYVDLTLHASMATSVILATAIFVHISVPHGSAASARLTIIADDMTI